MSLQSEHNFHLRKLVQEYVSLLEHFLTLLALLTAQKLEFLLTLCLGDSGSGH